MRICVVVFVLTVAVSAHAQLREQTGDPEAAPDTPGELHDHDEEFDDEEYEYDEPFTGPAWSDAHPDRTRGLPECGPGQPPPFPGAPYTCRPPGRPWPVHWALAVDWMNGLASARSMAPDLIGSAQGLGVSLDFGLWRWLQAGVRYQHIGIGRGRPEGAMENASSLSANEFLATFRLRGFTDEADRDAWTLGLGAGWSLRSSELGSGPQARVAISREGGVYVSRFGALTYALELAYEQALDDSELRMVLAALRGGLEFGIPTPGNVMELDSRPAIDYSVGLGWRLSFRHGPAVDLGLPLTSRLSLRFTADHGSPGNDGATWGVLGGARATLALWQMLPYVEAQAGWSWVAAAETVTGVLPRGAPRGDIEFGARGEMTCNTAIDLGVRVSSWFDGAGLELRDVGIVLRFEHGTGATPRAWQWGKKNCGRGAIATRPRSPSRYVAPAPAPRRRVDMDGSVDVDIPSVDVDVPSVEVEIEPVVVEVDIGVVLLGGMVRASIDPRLLPLAQLRQAGFVKVEILGPAGALAQFEGELSAVLRREGLSVNAWATTAAEGRKVRARFTIWPPGASPSAQPTR